MSCFEIGFLAVHKELSVHCMQCWQAMPYSYVQECKKVLISGVTMLSRISDITPMSCLAIPQSSWEDLDIHWWQLRLWLLLAGVGCWYLFAGMGWVSSLLQGCTRHAVTLGAMWRMSPHEVSLLGCHMLGCFASGPSTVEHKSCTRLSRCLELQALLCGVMRLTCVTY